MGTVPCTLIEAGNKPGGVTRETFSARVHPTKQYKNGFRAVA
jgi:hypothetical protein